MPRTPQDMYEAVVRNLPAKTGRTIDEWVTLARQGPPAHKDRLTWLKTEHGLGHSTAFIITSQSLKPDDYVAPAEDEIIDKQYAGDKAALRPIYEKLLGAAQSFGEVKMEPRQSYVALARTRQFALMQPSTRTRLDLGLRLDGTEANGRLQAAGSFGTGGITHRVALTSPQDVDREVLGWLRAAYDQS